MAPLPLMLQTLYADLVQEVHAAPAEAGSVYKQTIKGIDYLYLRKSVEKRGGTGFSAAPTIRQSRRERRRREPRPPARPSDARQ